MSEYDEKTEKQLMILRFITWAMMVVAPLCYLFIAFQFDAQGIQAKAGNDLLIYLLLAIGLLSPLVIPVVTKGVIQAERRKGWQEPPAQLFQRLSIIGMAMVEAIYIYGLVVFLLTGKFTNMLYFYPIGIVWSFIYWPKREKYDRLLEKLNQP